MGWADAASRACSDALAYYGSDYGILQPVLQWGPSYAGGGANWSIASWYVPSASAAFHTTLVQVEPGDTLTGVMTQTGSSGQTFDYDCVFSGFSETNLTIQNIAELQWCNETLEAYSIQECSDYPNAAGVSMGDITIKTGDGYALPSWQAEDLVTDCGQYCLVGSMAQVMLYFRSQ